MKLVNRISAVAVLVFLSIGCAGALILLHGCADIKMLFQPARWFTDMHTAIPFLALGVLLFGAVVLLFWMLYFTRHVIRTLRKSENFIREILSGNIPGRLSTEGIREDEITSLFSSLNFMRDRQVNLAERLRQQREGEEKLRQEIEFYDDLQLAAFSKLLPEMRRSAGVVKAFTLIELAQARREQQKDLESRTMLASLRRQARLSRELDFITDVAKLERKRWSAPLTEKISTIELARELNSRCQLSLKSREITFVCEYRAGTPEYISSDRELLYQLLYLIIRSTARSLLRGSQVTFSVSGKGKNAVFEIADRAQDPHREALAENYRKSFLTGARPDLASCSLSTIGLELTGTVAGKIGSVFEVESTAETPTILRLLVPAVIENNTSENPLLMHKAPVPAGTAAHAPAEGTLNVLLADDDSEEAESFFRLFAYDDITLSRFSSCEELLKGLSETKKVDGIVISLAAAAYDPLKLISQLRRTAGNPDLPILLVTPIYQRELALELESVPNAWCLVSPLNFAQAASLLRNGRSA